jgi:hypothetical protein
MARSVVEHRVHQQLSRQVHLAAIAGQQGECGSQAATRAGPADGDAIRVDRR